MYFSGKKKTFAAKKTATTKFWVLIILIALVGCSHKRATVFQYHRVDSQAEAGSAQVSVQLVAPWESYVDAMSANFVMNEKTALSSVLPSTLLLTRKELDAVQFAARVAPPISSTNSTATQATDAAGVGTNTSEQTVTQGPGDASQITFEPSIVGDRTAPGLSGKSVDDTTIGVDPFLQHQVALALKQEVALLNRQVRDAALRYGFIPYVVRLQVSIIPDARHQPYDVNLDTSFFNAGALKDAQGKPFKTPYVMPMLVTDNLEAALQSRSIDQLRKQALALSMLLQGFSASFDFQRFNEQYESVFGRDLNSLMTVARASDNTLRVRLGAQLNPKSRYMMVTRTHNVSFVLLVDRRYVEYMKQKTEPEPPTMSLAALTEMIDALTGKKLRSRTRSEVEKEIRKVAKQYGIPNIPTSVIGSLIQYAQKNEYSEYVDALKARDLLVPREAFWVSLVKIVERAQFKAASFDLPGRGRSSMDSVQALLLVDDGKNTSTVLHGQDLVKEQLKVTLVYKGTNLPSDSLETKSGKLSVKFPSLAQWGFIEATDGETESCTGHGSVKVEILPNPWEFPAGTPTSFQTDIQKCWYHKKKTEDASKTPAVAGTFVISTATSVVMAKEGVGTLKVSVKIQEKEDVSKTKVQATPFVTVVLSGADIDEAKGDGVTLQAGNTIKVTKTTDVIFKLSRLNHGDKIKIQAEDKDKKKAAPIELLILATDRR